jgi:hypothetical protein
MNHDEFLSTLKELSDNFRYAEKTLEILKAAQILSESTFDDVTPETNLLRVSLLIDTYISRLECPFDEIRISIKDLFTTLTLAKARSSKCSESPAK